MTGNVESVAADFTALRRDIAHLIETLSGILDQQAQASGARVSDAVEGVKDKIAHAAGDARKSAEAAGDEITGYIDRNPLTAILIAIGLGLFVGVITRPRG
jgi:ElaB/YqjD/DUF883 family membrane-anchored ribosome-binding protein